MHGTCRNNYIFEVKLNSTTYKQLFKSADTYITRSRPESKPNLSLISLSIAKTQGSQTIAKTQGSVPVCLTQRLISNYFILYTGEIKLAVMASQGQHETW